MRHKRVQDAHRGDLALLDPDRIRRQDAALDQEHHRGVHQPGAGRHQEAAAADEEDAADDDRQQVEEGERALRPSRQVHEAGDHPQVADQLSVHLGPDRPHRPGQDGVGDRHRVSDHPEQVERLQRKQRPVHQLDDEGADHQGRDDHDPEGHEPVELAAELPLLRSHPFA